MRDSPPNVRRLNKPLVTKVTAPVITMPMWITILRMCTTSHAGRLTLNIADGKLLLTSVEALREADRLEQGNGTKEQ